MMGRLNHDQEQFFYSFRLDEAVPEDHTVREIANDAGRLHDRYAARQCGNGAAAGTVAHPA